LSVSFCEIGAEKKLKVLSRSNLRAQNNVMVYDTGITDGLFAALLVLAYFIGTRVLSFSSRRTLLFLFLLLLGFRSLSAKMLAFIDDRRSGCFCALFCGGFIGAKLMQRRRDAQSTLQSITVHFCFNDTTFCSESIKTQSKGIINNKSRTMKETQTCGRFVFSPE
jgi:hypothetical protein